VNPVEERAEEEEQPDRNRREFSMEELVADLRQAISGTQSPSLGKSFRNSTPR
jgi:hypothetical protein